MKAIDLTGSTFGSLVVISFDKERHDKDKLLRANGEISRIRRYYICKCLLCGRTLSVRGENLVSGNTTGCGCDAGEKTGCARHNQHLNKYWYDNKLNCFVGKSNNTDGLFLFDADDFDIISKLCWYENNCGYMITRLSKYKQIFMHRLIAAHHIEIPEGMYVDHINRNRLDCRISNLRVCTPRENSWNVGVHSNSKSGERGVRWHEKTGKWNAYITIDGIFKSLGYYDDIESAVLARRSAEVTYRGEYAPV